MKILKFYVRSFDIRLYVYVFFVDVLLQCIRRFYVVLAHVFLHNAGTDYGVERLLLQKP